MKQLNTIIFLCMVTCCVSAQRIVVDQQGHGNFTSIQAAIESLSDSAARPRTIIIYPGRYTEKLFISKHNIIFKGTDRDHTIIVQSIARDEWRCDHPDDWGVATINLNGNDITLENLTIANEYAKQFPEPRKVSCAADSSAAHERVITTRGHQMALRSILSTRLRAINCRFTAFAGDTVSPWNLVDGMFYFKDCIMEGGVDFYCPRGFAWAENCRFFANTGDASIWHDGSGNQQYKTVLKNCFFDGYDGFKLGRYHKDAQFYLVGCKFSEHMANKDIYLVPTTNTIRWGRRVYFADCHRTAGDFTWFADNLTTAQGAPKIADININWLFGNKWAPQKN